MFEREAPECGVGVVTVGQILAVRKFGYFDPETSWDAEDVIIKRVAAAFEPPFRDLVEVRNQARVHLWFEGKFGEPYAALTCTDDAPAQFVAPAFALAVRLEKESAIDGQDFEKAASLRDE